jgi:YD repeat-containing protein
VKLSLKVFSSLALAAGLALLAGHSLAQECMSEFGGTEYCSAPQPTAWTIDACDEAAAATSRRIAWCSARGGTWNGTDCVDPAPFTEGNVGPLSAAFANNMNSSGCQLAGDTGWHTTYSTSFCTGGGDNYNHGRLLSTSRRISVACANGFGETISVTKTRGLSCPPGTTSTLEPIYGELCISKLEDCPTCPKYGNPVAPASGVKVQTETDYRNSHGLEITRHYHSFRFYDAYSNVQNSHVDGGLGIVWRTSYDKRVILLSPHNTAGSPGRYARADANGDIQVFGATGTPFINYRGSPGTLAIVSGTGYYYKDPDATEFYDTNGRLRSITKANGQALTLTYSDGTASAPNGGFLVDDAGNATTLTMPANLLIRVTDSHGNSLSFAYGSGERIVVATEPGGGQHLYAYDALNNLVSVTYPDGKTREYRYNEPANMTGGANLPHALTSIVDENASVFASFTYDPQGRAVSTEHAGGVNKYQITYNTNGSSTAIDPLNTTRTLGFATVGRVQRFTGASLPGMAGTDKAATHNTAGMVSSRTDFNDVKTCYDYLAAPRQLETVRVEGLAASADCATVLPNGATLPAGSRKILTEWHPRFRLPARISEPGRRTTFAYNGDTGVSCEATGATIAEGGSTGTPIAVLCSKTVQATSDVTDGAQGFSATTVGTARTWTYTYSATGQVLTMNGPRTDVTDTATYTYDSAGNVATITNAASQVTQFTSYNAHGQPLTIVDPNGLTTTMTYDARQRLKTRAVGAETTTYDYDDAGQLIKVTLPDGSFLEYGYDAAHRLTSIGDNLGNRIVYTLDAMGNRTLEEVRDPSNALAQTRSRVYSSLNRLFQELGAQSQTTEYTYDDQGNVLTIKDPLNRVTTNQYDALHRLKQVTSPAPVSAVT